MSATSAGMHAQPTDERKIEPTKRAGVGAKAVAVWPTAKSSVPHRMERSRPRRGTTSRGATASISPTSTSSGPDSCGPQPKRYSA